MKYRLILIALSIIIGLNSTLEAQSTADKNQIKAYYSRAMAALKSKNWDEAITNVEKVQELSGQNLAAFELIKIRAYWGKKDIARAQRSIEVFNSLNPNEAQKRQVAAYVTSINDAIQSEKTRFENLKTRDKQRRQEDAKEEAERRAREEKIESIIVLKEAISAGNRMRNIIQSAANVGDHNANLHMTIQMPDGFTFGGDQKYSSRTLFDQVRISGRNAKIEHYGFDNYPLFIKFRLEGVPNCNRVGRGRYANYSIYLRFVKEGNQMRIGYKTKGFMNEETFGCTNEYIGFRGDFTKEADRIGFNFLDNVVINLKNLTLTEDEILAYQKDQKQFMNEFIYSIRSPQKRDYAAIQRAIDEKRKAAEKRQTDLTQAESYMSKGRSALASNQFIEAIGLFREAQYIYREYNQNTSTAQDLIELSAKRLIQSKQIEFNQIISQLNEAKEKHDLDNGYSLIEQGNEIISDFPNLEKWSEFYTLKTELREMIDDREEIITFANKYEPKIGDYFLTRGNEQKMIKALEYDPTNKSYLEKLEQVRYLKKRKTFNTYIRNADSDLIQSSINLSINKYEAALALFPDDSIALAKLKSAKLKLEEKKESKAELIVQIKAEIQNGDKFNEAFLARIRGKIQDYVKDYPDDLELILAATDLYINEKLGLEEAFELTKKASAIDPNNQMNFRNIGEILYANKSIPEAMEYLKAALGLPSPYNEEIIQKLTQGHYTLALRSQNKELESQALIYANMGKAANIDHPVFDRVINRFCPGNENCKN